MAIAKAGVREDIRFNVPDIQEVPEGLADFGFITAQLLMQRGIQTKAEAEKFLNPKLEDLGDPFDLLDMDKAVRRIGQAITKKEKIVVYGDYDVDGTTSSTILVSVLKELGARVSVYLPERMKEGYGLNKNAIGQLQEDGANLIITVDNGTTNVEEIDLANTLNMDVIVVDHHLVPEVLPKAYALINPKRPDSKYKFRELAAVGVTYQLARALIGDKAQQYLDLVALGTVADVVPLIGENRILTVFGLKALNQTKRVGIKALIDVAGLKDKQLETYHIGFQLGPRINAAGRIDHAHRAFELLNEADKTEAHSLAHDLNNLNSQRQKMTEQILESAEARADKWRDKKIIIIGNEGWSVGVVGIIAGRLTEKYSKPSIVFEYQKDVCKGSARSVDGVHLVELLNNVSEHIEGYGGHAKAAGMTIAKTKFASFKNALEDFAEKSISEDLLRPSVNVSLKVDPDVADPKLFETILRFSPFGFGNTTPVFEITQAKLESFDAVGNAASIIRMMFVKDEQRIQITGFDKSGELILSLKANQEYDVAFTISSREWNGRKFMQQKLVALRPTS